MQLKTHVAVLLFAAASATANTQIPLLKVGNDWYTNVTVTSVSTTDIYFKHSRGMGNAKLKNLDAETQKLFKFDPAKASEVEKQQAEADFAYRTQVRKAAAAPRPKPAAQSEPGNHERGEPGDIVVPKIYAKSVRGQPAPRLVIEKWLTAQPDLTGKFIMIDFWATWCGPCRRSIPEINKLHARFKDRMVIIGLSDEEEDAVRAMKSPKIDYFVAIDRSQNMESALKISGIPHAIIIDPQGIVRFEGMPTYLNERNVAGLLARYSK